MKILILALAALIFPTAGFATTPSEDAAAIRRADQAWSASFTARNLDAAVAAVDRDGRVLAPNAPAATTPSTIRDQFKGFFAIPDVRIGWTADLSSAARSGEIGYSTGRYTMNWTGDGGNRVEDHGKYVTVWKKEPDGSWKVLLDIFNSDLPAH